MTGVCAFLLVRFIFELFISPDSDHLFNLFCVCVLGCLHLLWMVCLGCSFCVISDTGANEIAFSWSWYCCWRVDRFCVPVFWTWVECAMFMCLLACMLLLALLFSAFVIFAWFVRTRVFCVSGVGVRGNHVLSCFGVFCLLRCSWCYWLVYWLLLCLWFCLWVMWSFMLRWGAMALLVSCVCDVM